MEQTVQEESEREEMENKSVCNYTSSALILCVISRLYISIRAGSSPVLLTTALPEPSTVQGM